MNGSIQRHHRPRGYVALAPSVPYLVDASSFATGRHIRPTKRRFEFRFGFASFPHLARGCQGPECRGSEHHVVLLWSLVSGKRRVLLDGHDIYLRHTAHFDTQQFSFPFVIPGLNHNLLLVAQASGSCNLFIDGQSIFSMLRIYELGGPECRRRYAHVYAYAERVPRVELEKALANEGDRRSTPEPPSSYDKNRQDGDIDSLSDEGIWELFTHLDPRDRTEEKRMYNVARSRSVRSESQPFAHDSHLRKINEQESEEEMDLIDLSGPSWQQPSCAPHADDLSTIGNDGANSVGGWGAGPTMPSYAPYAAPPPTWEQLYGEFDGMSAAPSVTGHGTTASTGWGTGPPPVPFFVNAPPPPTWEQTQATFGWGAQQSAAPRRYSE